MGKTGTLSKSVRSLTLILSIWIKLPLTDRLELQLVIVRHEPVRILHLRRLLMRLRVLELIHKIEATPVVLHYAYAALGRGRWILITTSLHIGDRSEVVDVLVQKVVLFDDRLYRKGLLQPDFLLIRAPGREVSGEHRGLHRRIRLHV